MKKIFVSSVFAIILVSIMCITVFAANTSNDDFASATSISVGSSCSGELTSESTKDYYKFTLSESGRINIKVTTTMGSTYYYIYDANNARIWGSSYSNGTDQNVDLVAGTYYFYVGKSSALGSYNFKLSFVTAGESKSESEGNVLNSIEAAPSITLGTEYRGQLAINDTLDYYKFSLAESGRVNVKVTTTMGSTYYYIYDANNSRIWGSSYSNGTDQNVDLTAGTYYLYVGKSSATGNYSFKLSFTTANESKGESVGNTLNAIESAPSITLGTEYKGQLAVNDTLDYYKFSLAESGRLNVNVTTTMGSTYYYIYDVSNSRVWGNSYSNGTDQDVDLVAGTYYFYVGKSSATGNYSFKLSFTTASESKGESVGNTLNTIESAPSITLGTEYKGQLAVNDTLDYYKFSLVESGRLNVNVTTTMGSTYYYIYDVNNARVWGNSYSNGTDQNVDLVAGTYYFYVGKSSSTGIYRFKLTFDESNESFTESQSSTNNKLEKASAIQLNKIYTGQLALNDTVDYYEFTVESKNKFFVNVSTSMGSTYYYIYNESNVKVWGNSYNSGVDNKEVELEAGKYYFYVGKSSSTGTYTFSLTQEHNCSGSFTIVQPPTCNDPGIEEKNCSICGKLLDTQSVPANGHTCDNWVIDVEATCSSEGKHHAICGVCGETVSENIPMIAHSVGEWSVILEPTCHSDGTRTRECSACDYCETETLSTLTHDFGDWSVAEPPTCGQAGVEKRTCSLCGDIEEQQIEQLTHEYGEWIVISGSKLIPPIVREKTCELCGNIETVKDWSNIWITILVGIALIGVTIGIINYIVSIKKAQKRK